jgi:hypothetical protein
MLAEYKKRIDADKKKANFKTLGRNGSTEDNRDGQIAVLTVGIIGFKVTVLVETGSVYYTAQCCGGCKEAWLSSQGGGVARAHHAAHGC